MWVEALAKEPIPGLEAGRKEFTEEEGFIGVILASLP